jgi:hypothetical protein
MTAEAIALRFELVQDECCSLCNPVRFADYEQACVRVHRDDLPQGAFYVCLPCVEMLRRAVRGEPSTLVLPAEISRFMHELVRRYGTKPDGTIH